MPRNPYEPFRLNRTNRYAGYQFHTRIRMDGMSDTETFHYTVLSVYQWVLDKIPEEDRKEPGLQVPAPGEYASVGPETFASFHLSIGYALDITPLEEQGIWTLRIKETDQGVEGKRDPVVGRFFTTRVGVRLNEKGYTELGIRIDVTDPESEKKELPFAFRPGFVRTLALQPFVRFEQVREMRYGCPDRIETEEDYRKLVYLLENEDNQLPLIVFTHHRPGERKRGTGMSMEEFVKNESARSLLQFSGMQRPGMAAGLFGNAVSPQGAAAIPVPAQPPVMPYDVEHFARSAFGYALTVVLGDAFLERFSSRIRKEIRPGDIVLCGARKFRGGAAVVGSCGEGEAEHQKAYDAALLAAQSWSKHKAPYDYGSVVFEAEARKMEQHAQVMALVNSSAVEDQEKLAQMRYGMEILFNIIDTKDEQIEELKRQKDEAFERGEDFGEKGKAALEEENIRLKREASDKQDQIDRMLGDYQRAKEILGVLERMRKIDTMPESNEDVVRYFSTVYPDRLAFTERGRTEASGCGLRPEHLWEILYKVATDMVDVFRSVQGNLTEEEVMKATGFDVAFHEGSMTRKNSDQMRLREDEYEGKTISVEPHLRLKNWKNEPAHQRLHFCYDPEMKKIIIGYLGDHMESAATQYAK